MLTYPATIPLSRRSLAHLADLLRAERLRRGTRYRRLDPARQALLALAHLRNGDTPARLAGGFQVGVTTAWRYIREAVNLLAATAPTLTQAMGGIARLAYTIVDGTLIPTDRVANQSVAIGSAGDDLRRPWISRCGRQRRTPFKRHRRRRRLSRREKAVNRSHAAIRALGERAIATVKCWKLLAKLHCCPKRATALLAAILVLQLVEEQRWPS